MAIAACYLALAWIHDLRGSPRRTIIILLGAGFVYVLSCLWLHRGWPGWNRATRRGVILGVVLGAIALRVFLLAVPPSLSDDVYRYRWDGRVQAAGLNPYAEPPASAELASLRDPLWLRVNYPSIRTIYGPLAQWLFHLTYRLDPRLVGFQAMAALGDLLCIGLLLGCLGRWRLPRWRVALYAWSPLAAIESASNAHFDSWPTAAILLAVFTALGGATLASTVSLSAGVLFKTWPVLWFPLTFVRRPPWHAVVAVAVVGFGYLPFAGAGYGLLQPWLDYTSRWRFNDAGFFVLRLATGSEPFAKGVAAALLGGMLLYFWRRRTDTVRANYWLLLLALFLMPTIHPWYLLWALPLAAAALDLGWLTVTLLAPLSYWILVGAGPDSATWVEPVWVRFAIWVPALAVWAVQASRHGPAAPPAVDRRVSA